MASNKKKRPTAAEQSAPTKPSPSSNRPKKQDSGGDEGVKRVAPKDRPHRNRKRKGPRCAAIKANGQQCLGAPIKGSTVCHKHGGSAPAVREAANRRLLEAVIPALKELRKIIDKPSASDADKLRAISMVLNRTGYSEKQSIDIGLRPASEWEKLLTGNEVFDFDRSELDGTDRPALGGGDGLSDDALDAILDRRERERARDASTRLPQDGHDVVTGEVVDDPTPTKGAERGRTYRGRTEDVGPVSFPDRSDPRTRGTEMDPEPGGRYSRRRTQEDLYESGDDW